MTVHDGGAPSPPTARELGALDLTAHLRDPSRKQAFVTPMFDVIAPRYDDFTRLFSFGMDASWKRAAVTVALTHLHARAASGARGATSSREARRGRDAPHAMDAHPLVVDLACGTGDLAVAVARGARDHAPDVRVIGFDASSAMIVAMQARLNDAKRDADVRAVVHAEVGDMTAIALPDASARLVTAGYAVRNAPDPRLAVREAARVLETGGLYVTLDFYRPELTVWRWLLLRYLRVAGNVVGWAWHRSPVVYGYIAASIDHFVSWQAFSALLATEGFRVRSVKRWLGGGIAMHVAERVA